VYQHFKRTCHLHLQDTKYFLKNITTLCHVRTSYITQLEFIINFTHLFCHSDFIIHVCLHLRYNRTQFKTNPYQTKKFNSITFRETIFFMWTGYLSGRLYATCPKATIAVLKCSEFGFKFSFILCNGKHIKCFNE